MYKTGLTERMAEQTGLSKSDAAKALNAAIDIIEATVADGEKVQITGFGTFSSSKRKATEAFGKKVKAAMVPKFKAGATFKQIVHSSKKKAVKR
jgi:DNA-binding protein HU-beta